MQDARTEMLKMIRNRRPGYALERPFYMDPGFHQLDMELIWYHDWLFMGHDCEIPEPGNYMTVQIGDYPIVILRNKEGQIRAFHNSCRHRGSRVCSSEKGSAARLVCPYHQWTYDLNGKLQGARQMGAKFDKSEFSLRPVACELSGGYIFVSLAQQPEDFEPFRKTMEPYFLPHRLREAKVAHENTIIEKGNWKLVWENNRECYHCVPNHPELCIAFPEAPTVTGVNGADDDKDMLAHWQRCEDAGLPSRFVIDQAGQYRTVRAPLLDGIVGYTMHGGAAVKRGLSDSVTVSPIGTLLQFHYPTTWNHVLGDHAVTFRVLPVSPSETAVTTKWLVHKDAVEGVEYHIEELTHVWNQTNIQDRRIVEENARGIQSPVYTPGPYSEYHEGGVAQFLDWYAGFMEPRLANGVGSKVIPLRSVA